MRLTLAAIVVVLVLAATACLSSSKPRSKARHHATTGQTQPANLTLPHGWITASCAAAGTGSLPSDFLDPGVSVRSGAVVFGDALANRGIPSDYRPVTGNQYTPTRMLIALRKAHSALVEVAPSERKSVSLLFDPEKAASGQARPVTDGAPAVVLPNCTNVPGVTWIEHPGAAIVAGPRCARLLVTPLEPGTHEPLGKPVRVKIPYGRKMCGKGS